MDAAALAARIRDSFGRLADAPVWVAWNDVDGRKIPLSPRTGSNASSTDPTTWVPAGQALQYAATRGLTGVGLMLGPDPDANPDGAADKPWIVGVDYDNALRSDGTLMPWAQNLFPAGETYAEISPSGTGVKAFGYLPCRPEGLPEGQDGVKLRLGDVEAAGEGKRPGVEVYCGRRWFAVTGRVFGGGETLGDMSRRMPGLLANARPAASVPSENTSAADAYTAYSQPLTDAERDRANVLLTRHPDLHAAMFGTDWTDRSLALWTAADLAKGYRLDFRAFVHGLMSSAGSAGEHVRSQPDVLRAVARAWDRSPQPTPLDTVPPVAEWNPDAVAPVPALDLSMLDVPNPLGAPEVLPADLYSNPPPMPAFVLEGFLPPAPTALVGTGGTYKSTIWMGLAVHMLLARPLWGRHWWEGGSAVMLSREDERSVMLRRLHDLLHGMDVTERQYHDIIRHRLYLDDMTQANVRFVEADRGGNLHLSPAVDAVVDKYRQRGVAMLAVDPLVNFGPGEVHGNDGAAMLMLAGWALSRGLSGEAGRCNTTFIHHISMNAARDEVEDAHAGRSASAIGDNARAVYVLHRHKSTNKHRHIAPPEISTEAIAKGDVVRITMAKQSYARKLHYPLYVERVGSAFKFHEPNPEIITRQEAEADAPVRTPSEQARLDTTMHDIRGALRAHSPRPRAEIERIGASLGTRALAIMEAAGEIIVYRDGLREQVGLAPPRTETTSSVYGF